MAYEQATDGGARVPLITIDSEIRAFASAHPHRRGRSKLPLQLGEFWNPNTSRANRTMSYLMRRYANLTPQVFDRVCLESRKDPLFVKGRPVECRLGAQLIIYPFVGSVALRLRLDRGT